MKKKTASKAKPDPKELQSIPIPTVTCVGIIKVPNGYRSVVVEVPATMPVKMGKVQNKHFAVADAMYALEGTAL